MDLDEVMDEDTTVPVDDAIREIQNHGFDAFEAGEAILAYGQGIIMPEIVAPVLDGEVHSKTVMEWLNY